jgi:putative oxidoreductase
MLERQNETRKTVRDSARTVALTAMRAVAGVIMMTHGWMKLTDIGGTATSFAAMGIPVPDISAYLAVAGELLGGVGMFLGLLTPVAAVGVLSTMLVAIGFVHWDSGLLAKDGGFEYPLTMATVALYVMVRGAGPISLDAWWAKRRDEEDEARFTLPGQNPSSISA